MMMPACTMAYGDAFHFLARTRIEDDEVSWSESGNEDTLAARGELEAVCAGNVGRQRLNHLLPRKIDDGDGTVLRIGDPNFLAGRRNIKALRAIADANHGLISVGANSACAGAVRVGRCGHARRWSGLPEG
jgi:hypothetical protein